MNQLLREQQPPRLGDRDRRGADVLAEKPPQLPLTDFAKAYDGPPTDLKAEAEQEKQLQEALRDRAMKKQEELTKKGAATPGKP